jgi:hypothetical protein
MITRMLLILKQHRFEVLATVAICLGVTVAAVVEALRLNAVHFPADCDPYSVLWGGGTTLAPACRAASQQWVDVRNSLDLGLTRAILQFVPFVVGIMLGAPLVAREIETGTAPLSWALAGSRRRWLIPRMATVALLIAPLLLAVGLSADFLTAAITRGMNPYASFSEYMARGVPLVFWGLAAFTGTVALGTLLGRAMPAVLLAVVICFLARSVWEPGMNRFVLAPFSQRLPSAAEVQTGRVWDSFSEGDLVTYYETYMDGQPWSGDESAWWNEHMTVTVDENGNNIYTGPVNADGQVAGPYSVSFGFRADRYWPVVAVECAILLLGALLCAAIALFRVGRRRPY